MKNFRIISLFIFCILVTKTYAGGSPEYARQARLDIEQLSPQRTRSASAPPPETRLEGYKWINPDAVKKTKKNIIGRLDFERYMPMLRLQVANATPEIERFVREWSEVGPSYEIEAMLEILKQLTKSSNGTVDPEKMNLIRLKIAQLYEKPQPWYQMHPYMFAGLTASAASVATAGITAIIMKLKK